MVRLTLFICTLWLSGCASEKYLDEFLEASLPSGLTPTLNKTCIQFMGAAVGLFSLPNGSDKILRQEVQNNTVQGTWSHAPSLGEFAARDAEHRGAGIGATILDGKKCFRDMEETANEILFGNKTGFFFHSENRNVVIMIFDDPKGNGVIFVQAP